MSLQQGGNGDVSRAMGKRWLSRLFNAKHNLSGQSGLHWKRRELPAGANLAQLDTGATTLRSRRDCDDAGVSQGQADPYLINVSLVMPIEMHAADMMGV